MKMCLSVCNYLVAFVCVCIWLMFWDKESVCCCHCVHEMCSVRCKALNLLTCTARQNLAMQETHTHTHTHTHTCWFLWFTGTFHRQNGFILYKLYVLLPYTYPTPKLSPHRRRCISIFPQKNSLCMIYKRFKLWGH